MGIGDPSTFLGAASTPLFFALFAWLVGRRVASGRPRMLARDKNDHVDLMAVKFLAKLVRYCVYIFAFIFYAHFVPALSGLGTGIAGLVSASSRWLLASRRKTRSATLLPESPVALSAIQAWRPVAGDRAYRTGNRHGGKPHPRLHPAKDR